MAIIKVHGWAGVFRKPTDGEEDVEITDEATLRKLHGVLYSDLAIAEFLQDGKETRALHDVGVAGGEITLQYNHTTHSLYSEAQYTAPRLLTTEELETLRQYTFEQFIDGVGESDLSLSFDAGLNVSIGGADEWTTISQE